MSAVLVVAQALNSSLTTLQTPAWDDLTTGAQRAFLADAERIVDALNAAGYLTPALIDFPDQACEVCSVSHPGLPCPQPDLFGEAS